MQRRPLLTLLSCFLALPVLGAAVGCSTSGKAAGIKQVDDLLGRIERVHLECELARERAKATMDGLRSVVLLDKTEDVVAIFASLELAIRASEDQGYKLRAAIGPMKASAEAVFERWTQDLGEFSSVDMRRRSTERMDETRARYDQIVATAGPAVTSYEVFNAGLRDLALFLGHDLNTGALQSIGPEVEVIADDALALNDKLQACLAACREYVRAAAPSGTATISSKSTAQKPSTQP